MSWTKKANIVTDELGKFWVVTFPAHNSALEDILFEIDFIHMFAQVRGGLTEEEIVGVYKTKEHALPVAEKLLSSTKVD